MTWKNANRVFAALGVMAALAVVSGTDFIDGFALLYSAPTTTTTTTTVAAPVHHNK